MARRRFRRKSTGLWLPIIGTQTEGAPDSLYDAAAQEFNATNVPGGEIRGWSRWSWALTRDYTADQSWLNAGVPGITDWMSRGYYLRRLVGKLHMCIQQQTSGGSAKGIYVVAGFIIRKVNPDNYDQPWIDAESGNPAIETNIQDPWIWRRSWIFSNPIWDGPETNNQAWALMPRNTAEYPSALDGAHIDQKTKRIVRAEERLWFNIAARPLPLSEDPYPKTWALNGLIDMRLFASPIRIAGNRSNAAR